MISIIYIYIYTLVVCIVHGLYIEYALTPWLLHSVLLISIVITITKYISVLLVISHITTTVTLAAALLPSLACSFADLHFLQSDFFGDREPAISRLVAFRYP